MQGPAGWPTYLLDWRYRQHGNMKICWQLRLLCLVRPAALANSRGFLCNYRRFEKSLFSWFICSEFAVCIPTPVVCHHFYCFPWVAGSFSLFIFWIFCTARGERTFPKAQRYVTVKPQKDSGQGIHSLEWPGSYGEARPLSPEGHVAVAKLSSSFQKTVWEKCPLY